MAKFSFTFAHGVVLALISFMLFILTLIFYYAYSTRNSFDMVTEKYYEAELKYQDVIDAKNNTYDLKEKPSIKVIEKEGLEIYFPREFSTENTTGTIVLYRPSADELDRKFTLDISNNNKMFIVFKQFKTKTLDDNKGIYIVKINWKKENKNYYWEQQIKWK